MPVSFTKERFDELFVQGAIAQYNGADGRVLHEKLLTTDLKIYNKSIWNILFRSINQARITKHISIYLEENAASYSPDQLTAIKTNLMLLQGKFIRQGFEPVTAPLNNGLLYPSSPLLRWKVCEPCSENQSKSAPYFIKMNHSFYLMNCMERFGVHLPFQSLCTLHVDQGGGESHLIARSFNRLSNEEQQQLLEIVQNCHLFNQWNYMLYFMRNIFLKRINESEVLDRFAENNEAAQLSFNTTRNKLMDASDLEVMRFYDAIYGYIYFNRPEDKKLMVQYLNCYYDMKFDFRDRLEAILGITKLVDAAQVDKHYKKWSVRNHPDKVPNQTSPLYVLVETRFKEAQRLIDRFKNPEQPELTIEEMLACFFSAYMYGNKYASFGAPKTFPSFATPKASPSKPKAPPSQPIADTSYASSSTSSSYNPHQDLD